MTERGVVHGRFQGLHLKHMEYLLAAKMRCRLLYVGITHPDIFACPAASPLDVHGTLVRDNPLAYIERYEMIRDSLLEFGVKREEFEIIPFPVDRPDVLAQYAPADAVVEMVADTKHAVALRTKAGNGILLHVGIDTVQLGGKYFTLHVSQGQSVKKGDCLMEVDFEKIAGEGYDTTICLIFAELAEGCHVEREAERHVAVGDKIAVIAG